MTENFNVTTPIEPDVLHINFVNFWQWLGNNDSNIASLGTLIAIIVVLFGSVRTFFLIIKKIQKIQAQNSEQKEALVRTAYSDFIKTQQRMADEINRFSGMHKVPGPRAGDFDKEYYVRELAEYRNKLEATPAEQAVVRSVLFQQAGLANYYHANQDIVPAADKPMHKLWWQDGVVRWARELHYCDDTLESIANGEALTFSSNFIEEWVKPALIKYPSKRTLSI